MALLGGVCASISGAESDQPHKRKKSEHRGRVNVAAKEFEYVSPAQRHELMGVCFDVMNIYKDCTGVRLWNRISEGSKIDVVVGSTTIPYNITQATETQVATLCHWMNHYFSHNCRGAGHSAFRHLLDLQNGEMLTREVLESKMTAYALRMRAVR